jgi:hypothetical protein
MKDGILVKNSEEGVLNSQLTVNGVIYWSSENKLSI